MALAQSVACRHLANGGDVAELFAAFAGLVWERDRQVGLDCISAVDESISSSASAESASPSA